jgi:hypothetical protein
MGAQFRIGNGGEETAAAAESVDCGGKVRKLEVEGRRLEV